MKDMSGHPARGTLQHRRAVSAISSDPVPLIDAHHHAWRIGGPGQAWPDTSLPLIHRDFLLHDLRAAAEGFDLVATVLVQTQPDDHDTDWMFEEVASDPLVGAVVGWVELGAPTAPERLAELAGRPKMRGIRPMLQAIEDSAWILRDELKPAIAALCGLGLRFDALVQPRHLPALAAFARLWPDLPIVVDHGAKPLVADGILEPWRSELTALARCPNVWCKLSGLRTEQARGQSPDRLLPYVDHLVESFPERLMWGSDWPVLVNAGDSYGEWVRLTDRLTGLHEQARSHLFAEAAMQFYNPQLPSAQVAAAAALGEDGGLSGHPSGSR